MKVSHVSLMLVVVGGLIMGDSAWPQSLHNSAPAQPLFECGPQTMGQMACQAGTKCKCTYEAFGNLTRGLPPGSYRWDCSPLHGNCHVDIPAETTGTYGNGGRSTPSPIIVVPQVEPPALPRLDGQLPRPPAIVLPPGTGDRL